MSIQTFPDPDLDRRKGYKDSPEALHYAVELTLGIITHLGVDSLGDIRTLAPDPDHEKATEMALHVAGVHLTREQRGILLAHADKVAFIRPTVRATKHREGSKRLVVCVCEKKDCGGWALVSQGTPGPCPVGTGKGHKLSAPKVLAMLNAPPKPSKATKKDAGATKEASAPQDMQEDLFGADVPDPDDGPPPF